MCGIFGALSAAAVPEERVQAAHAVQGHRGPDGRGTRRFTVGSQELLLAHQRLAIIDLSDAGLQPMERPGQGCLIYNGELYNYVELRDELAAEGERFDTQSDTEVLLAALHRWGPARALGRFNWMGAFAWFDPARGRLVLARDGASEKPLYYCLLDGRLLFASEIKTLLTLAARRFELERDVVGRYLHQALVDTTTQTFFKGILQVPAAGVMEVDLRTGPPVPELSSYRPPAYEHDAGGLGLADCIEEVRRLFVDAVRLRLRSDVPVGVLLSGGVDSSSIAAVAQHLRGAGAAPRLLSAVSDDRRYDETPYINAMEQHLGQTSEKVLLRLDPATLMQDLERLNWINDEPVTGLSALAHLRLMEAARARGLIVIMSGQGADEIFLGYRKYLGFHLQSLLRQGRRWRALQVLAGFFANRTVITQFERRTAARYLPWLRGAAQAGDADGEWLRGWQAASIGLGPGSLAQRQLADVREFSVPALCHYEDRMSMAMGREIRLPFLDPRLIDLMLRVPDDFKLRSGWTKYCLRAAMQPFLPAQIAWRKDKQGFANPQEEWLKSELRAAVLDAFGADSRIVTHGIVARRSLLARYGQFCRQPAGSGAIWYREIFAPLSLESWMRRYAAWIA